MNRRGSLFDIILFISLILVIFVFFAGFMYGFNILTSTVTDPALARQITVANITEAGQATFGQINAGLSSLRWIALVIVISMAISILVSNFLVKAHPAFFMLYILIVVVAVVLSAYISNAYESILTGENPLTATLQSFTAMDFIMLHLPIWATIIGILGAIFLFIGVTLDREQGGSIRI